MRYKRSCSLSLGGNDGGELVTLGEGALVTTESPAGNLDSVLFLLLDASSYHFHHFALVGGKATDLANNSAHSSNTLVESTLTVRPAGLLGISIAFRLGNNESVVETDMNSTLLQLLHHLELKNNKSTQYKFTL